MRLSHVLTLLIVVSLLLTTVQPAFAAQQSYPALSSGAKYRYRGVLRISRTIFKTFSLELDITDASIDGGVSYQGTLLFELYSVREKTTERVTKSISGNFDPTEMFYQLYQINWTDLIHFAPRIDMLTIFNVKDPNALADYWESGAIADKIIERKPIVKLSWDIILGAYRKILYMEIFTARWFIQGDRMYIIELDISIDLGLGVVTKMRLAYSYLGSEYEVRVELADTNRFMKYTFYMGVIGFIVALIAVWIVLKKKVLRKKK